MLRKLQFISDHRSGITLAVVTLFAAISEIWLLRDHLPMQYSPYVLLLAVAFCVGLAWTSCLMLLQNAGRGLLSLKNRYGDPVAWVGVALFSLLTLPLAVVYIVSWNLFLRTGRFPGWDVIGFTAHNKYMLWRYLVEGESGSLQYLIGVGVIGLAVLPMIFALAMFAAQVESKNRVRDFMSRIWCGWAIVLLLGIVWIIRDESPQRRAVRLDHLQSAANPMVTLFASFWESWRVQPISPLLTADDLDLRADEAWTPPDTADKPSIIIVAMESLRHDVVHLEHQGRQVTPYLNALARRGLEWKRAYAQSTHSDYADVCTVSSLYPLRTRLHHFYRYDDPWPRTRIYDLLKPAGYATAIISSQNESWGSMDAFLDSPNLDVFYHPERSDDRRDQVLSVRDPGFNQELQAGALVAGKFPDRRTTSVAIQWIREQAARNKPFFLSMNFQSSHFPYLIPDDAARPFTPYELDADVSFMSYPREKTPNVRNAYYNALHESDRQLGRLLAALSEMELLDDVILLVIGENGEAFHENGSIGHAREPVEPVIHVATVMHAPRYLKPGVEEYPLEHVDLMPTVLGLMGWPSHPNFQGIDTLSADRPPSRERLLFFHVNSPAARADALLFGGRWKYVINYRTGQRTLYDIDRDPGETSDLSAEQPKLTTYLQRTLNQWRNRQLAYYHFPNYYTKAFPPKPPRWESLENAFASQDSSEAAGTD